MMQGQVLGVGGMTLFLFNFFKVYHFYIQKLLCYAFEEKLFFCHNFMKKGHSKLSKNERENIHQIKITYL